MPCHSPGPCRCLRAGRSARCATTRTSSVSAYIEDFVWTPARRVDPRRCTTPCYRAAAITVASWRATMSTTLAMKSRKSKAPLRARHMRGVAGRALLPRHMRVHARIRVGPPLGRVTPWGLPIREDNGPRSTKSTLGRVSTLFPFWPDEPRATPRQDDRDGEIRPVGGASPYLERALRGSLISGSSVRSRGGPCESP